MQIVIELTSSAVDFERGQVLYYLDENKKPLAKTLESPDITECLDNMIKDICDINPRFFVYKLMSVRSNEDKTGIIIRYNIAMPLDTKLKKGKFYDRSDC